MYIQICAVEHKQMFSLLEGGAVASALKPLAGHYIAQRIVQLGNLVCWYLLKCNYDNYENTFGVLCTIALYYTYTLRTSLNIIFQQSSPNGSSFP